MKKMLKRLLSIVLTLTMIIGAVPLTGFVGLELPDGSFFGDIASKVSGFFDGLSVKASAVTSGTCGDNLTWTLDEETGILSITGTGDMYDYPYNENTPWYCNNLIKSLTISNGVTSIGNWALSGLRITSLEIPDSVTRIGSCSFYSCSNLKSINIPDSVTLIAEGTFYNCSSLASVEMHDNITSIGEKAFSNCTSLTDIVIPDSVVSIEENAFSYCTSLTDIVIPDSVTSIGYNAFSYCENLKSISIGNGVTNIGSLFDYCNKLTNVTIGSGVTNINDNVFSNITSLETINVDPLNTVYSSDDFGVLFNKDKTTLIQFPQKNKAQSYIIPDSVTNIGNSAFKNCDNLTSIEIPDSVTSIVDYAFSSCDNLTSIEIPDSVTSIGNNAFAFCKKITSMEFPDSVKNIGNCALYYCEKLTSVTVGSGLINLGGSVFSNCQNLTSVKILSNNYKKIASGLFYECRSLTSFEIPDSVTSIGGDAFYNCRNLTNIKIPDTVTSIGSKTFYNCMSLTNIVIPDSVTSIGNNAFNNCNALTSITSPIGITGMDSYVFSGCDSVSDFYLIGNIEDWLNNSFELPSSDNVYLNGELVTDIVIPESISTIKLNTFNGWRSLKSVTIPNSVTSISQSVFEDCTALESVTIGDSVTSIGSYAFKNCHALKSIKIPEGVTTIESQLFYGCSGLTSVTIGNSVTSIGSAAFYACKALTSIPIPDSVTNISSSAFDGCTSLTSITIPDNVTRIPQYTFRGCSALSSITIPNGVTGIGTYAFAGCDTLKSIIIPDSVTSIESYAFQTCRALTNITIPDSVTSISKYAFAYCSALESVTIGNSVTSIGNNAFYNCSGLKSITIPIGIKSMGSNIFSGCNGVVDFNLIGDIEGWLKKPFILPSPENVCLNGEIVTDIVVPESISSIKNNTFSGWHNLKKVTITDSVTSIGGSAFSNCTSLEFISIPDSVTSIGDYAFRYCSNLKYITIPIGIKSMGTNIFSGCDGIVDFNLIGDIEAWLKNPFVLPSPENVYLNGEIVTDIVVPESIMTIKDYTFKGWHDLKIVTIPNSVTTIGRSAFFNCSALEFINIPDSVTSIGDSAFEYCTALRRVNIGNGVSALNYVGFSTCSNLKKLIIPGSVTNIYEYTFPRDMEIICIPGSYAESYAIEHGIKYSYPGASGDGLGTLVVDFSYPQEINPYKGLVIRLTGLTDGKIYSFFVEGYKSNLIEGVYENQAYSLDIVSDRGVVFASVDKIEFDEMYTATVTLDNLLPRINAKLTVTDTDGNLIESGYNAQWAFADDGNWVSNGNTMKDVTVGTELIYKVTLSESLVRKYVQPEAVCVTVDESGNFVCELSALPTVDIKGTVKSAEGKAVSANVVITQLFENGISSSMTVSSDVNGEFSAIVADVPVTITVKKFGYKDFVWSGSPNKVPAITLEKLTGDTLTLDIFKAQLDSNLKTRINSADNLSFTVKADGKNVNDFYVQYPSLIIPGIILSDGTNLSVTVTDNLGNYIPETAEIEYVDGKNDTMEIILLPKGKISVNISSSDSEENILMVFDNVGKKVETLTITSLSAQSSSLEAGSYTAVVMEKTSLLAAVPSLAKLKEYGLVSGTDYFEQKVTVENGKLSEICEITVPDFDESKLYYTDSEQTYMCASSSSVVIGNLLTVTVSFGFDAATAKKVSGTNVNVTLPEGCNIYLNGVSVDDILLTDYTFENHVLSIPVNKTSGLIKILVRPVELNENGYFHFASALDFILSGTAVTQPLGTIQVEVSDMKFTVPSRTATEAMISRGQTIPRSKIEIFVDGVLAATGRSNLAGLFNIPYELVNPYNFRSYSVHCRVTTPDGDTFVSSDKTVIYDTNTINVSKITMVVNRVEHVFDYLNMSDRILSYTIAGSFTATFKVEFTENNPERVSDVYVVTINNSGAETYVPVTYYEKLGYWVGTYKYDSVTAPVGVTLAFNDETVYPDCLPVDRAEEFSKSYTDYVGELENYLEDNLTVSEAEFVGDSVVAEFTLGEQKVADAEIISLGYENFNLDSWKDKLYMVHEDEGGNVYEYYEVKDNVITIYAADEAEEVYFKIVYTLTPSTPPEGELSTSAISIGLTALSVFENIYSRSALRRNADALVDILDSELNTAYMLIMAMCKNGQPRLDSIDKANCLEYYSILAEKILEFREYINSEIKEATLYDASLIVFTAGLSGALKALKGVAGNTNAIARHLAGIHKTIQKNFFGKSNVKALSKVAKENIYKLSQFLSAMTAKPMEPIDQMASGGMYLFTNRFIQFIAEGGFFGLAQRNIESDYQALHKKLQDFIKEIKSGYISCEPKKPEINPDSDTPIMSVTPIVDPSGFVCEAVLSNRLEGVTVTCYYSPNEDGSDAVIWNAEDFGQINPLLTDKNGYYEWFVPEGWWQVRYEKDGYEIGYSDWLPVPPPQTKVHYSMTSLDSPLVERINAYSDSVEIRFTQYMNISSINSSNIIISSNGTEIMGEWSAVNAEESLKDSNISYASVFKFVPYNSYGISDRVTIEIRNVINYAGKAIKEKHIETVPVVLRPESISAASELNVAFDESKEFEIVINASQAGVGKTVLISSSSPSIVSASTSKAIADENGKVHVTITGLLPGEATLEYNIEGTDISGSTKVVVGSVTETVATVRASVENGSTVEEGTTVSFYCDTLGAEIYYTTDLSCPCVVDNPARKLYTGPITLTEDVIFITYAVKDGMNDSDTKGYSYTVKPKPIPVTGVTIDFSESTLMVGKTLQLNASVVPSNADNQKINWSSSNSSIAKVDENGLVTALSPGKVEIKAESAEGTCYSVRELTIIPDEFTVKWIVEGNTIGEVKTKYGAIIIEPEAPELEGYKFIGWTPEIPDIMPSMDLTFTAVFESIEPDVPEVPTDPTPKPTETTKPVITEPSTVKPTEPTTTKPVETTKPSTTKPAETEPSTTKPAETKPSTTKPVEVPTTKPSTTKPAEPTTKPVVTVPALVVEIRKPSQTEIKYGDSIILHADVDGELPKGAKIEWTADNSNFTIVEVSADSKACTVTPSASGGSVFTAKVVDANGNELCNDTQSMTSKAGFFQKLIAFFKKLFGLTKVIPEAFKGVF